MCPMSHLYIYKSFFRTHVIFDMFKNITFIANFSRSEIIRLPTNISDLEGYRIPLLGYLLQIQFNNI